MHDISAHGSFIAANSMRCSSKISAQLCRIIAAHSGDNSDISAHIMAHITHIFAAAFSTNGARFSATNATKYAPPALLGGTINAPYKQIADPIAPHTSTAIGIIISAH